MMKHIISFSGGKDSTAMLLRMIELDYPIDIVMFADTTLEFPEMYEYRDLRSRLLAKVERAYRRAKMPLAWNERQYQVWQVNSMELPIENGTVDAIVSSPPYFGALDYARDNRLRLWFLGCEDWKELDNSLTANQKVYIPQMSLCLQEMCRVLRTGGY